MTASNNVPKRVDETSPSHLVVTVRSLYRYIYRYITYNFGMGQSASQPRACPWNAPRQLCHSSPYQYAQTPLCAALPHRSYSFAGIRYRFAMRVTNLALLSSLCG